MQVFFFSTTMIGLRLNYFEELRTLQDKNSDNLVNWDQDLLKNSF